MSSLKAAWKWICAIGGALIIGVLSLLMYGRRKFTEGASVGDAKRRAKDDREDLRHAEETGDDAGVLDEWRKHR